MIDEKIVQFIKEHHVLSLATIYKAKPYSASCFYAYSEKDTLFTIASDEQTQHIKNTKENENIAGTISLETSEIGKIRGLQFEGVIKRASTKEKALYIKTYPYALALNPTIWSLHAKHIKYTDNRLGFGKKINWTIP